MGIINSLNNWWHDNVVIPRYRYRTCRRTQKIIRYLRQSGRPDYIEVADYLEGLNVAEYLKTHALLPVFPYKFTDKYEQKQVEGYVDEDGYPYVLHNGKKLFGPREWSADYFASYYVGLLMEQDEESPHRYLQDDVVLTKDDVVADVGAAEGIFTLDIIDRVKKVYLFECDEMWIVPLKKTLAPWGGTASSSKNMYRIRQTVAA